MYVTADDVYAATSLDNTVVAEATVNNFIKAAEKEVDLLTFTTYWASQDSGTATSSTNNTLVDNTQSWTVNDYANQYVYIIAGTGSGQVRKISSNTSDTLTVDTNWSTNPSTDSDYVIFYSATTPNIDNLFDGTGTSTFFVDAYPIRIIQELTINSTSVTTTNIYLYNDLGKMVLKNNAEKNYFDNAYPQLVDLNYWFGVYPIPEEVKRYVIVAAGVKLLSSQMGGTYNTPSTYTLPEGSVTIGQAYVNIKSTRDTLMEELKALKEILIKYPSFF